MSTGWTREQMAARAARDIPDGAYVNLGIGIPELVAQFVPEGREFIYHTENGLLGMGPPPTEEERDLDLMNAGAVRDADPSHTPCGSVSSGGTESIIIALLAYRGHARQQRNVTQPQIIVPDTAHPAFLKGGHLLGIDTIIAPCDPRSTQVDVDFVRRHINERTIALVGSACNYPYGTIDPIGTLSDLALEFSI